MSDYIKWYKDFKRWRSEIFNKTENRLFIENLSKVRRKKMKKKRRKK